MGLDAELKSESTDVSEEWFLESLEAQSLPLDRMLGALKWLRDDGRVEQAESWSELLQDALVERLDEAGMLRLQAFRIEGRLEDDVLRKSVANGLQRAFKSRVGSALVKHCGLGNGLPLQECVRRLDLMKRLQPGALCLDKTWGFGIVKRVDEFYGKFTIDFDGRPGHAMTFGYAAEALEIVPDDHILAQRHRDSAGVAQRVREEPGEVVRQALRSFGAMSAPRLREVLEGHGLIGADDWKAFWEGARRALKKDPLVVIPTQRTRPIELLDKQKTYDQAWFDALSVERYPDRILERIGELEAAESIGELPDAFREALRDRLAYIVHAAVGQDMVLGAKAVLTSLRLGLADVVGAEALIDSLEKPAGFLVAAEGLPARDMGAFLDFLFVRDAEGTAALFESVLDRASLSLLSDLIGVLLERGRESGVRARLETAFRSGAVSEPMVAWCCKSWATVLSWGVTTAIDLLGLALDVLGRRCGGDALRAQNALRDCMSDKPWLEMAMQALRDPERADFLKRVDGTRGWDVGDRRSVMAGVIRLYPELESVLADGGVKKREARYTSWRSHQERRELLRELVEVLIPKNSREIALARSYGDLSENHEYKAAKEHQGILLKRRGDMERDLEAVQGSDFDGFPTDRAGMGNMVDVRYEDGRAEQYAILGEWDRDELLGIISSQSRLAKAMAGHGPGDEIVLEDAPDGAGRCRISAVSPLSEAVKAWIAGARENRESSAAS